jgi:predicted RNase H-like HicB family nuclease
MANKKEINKLRSIFPAEISVSVKRLPEGGFVAEVATYPGILTEAETFPELIENVNDALYTYFEIPQEYLEFMPSYCPPMKLAQEHGMYPDFGTAGTLKLVIQDGIT